MLEFFQLDEKTKRESEEWIYNNNGGRRGFSVAGSW